MNNNKPYVLSIAGFDPSAGAGVLSDIKTFENNGVYGFGVNTANTIQNDSEFDSVDWVDSDIIIQQIDVLTRKFNIEVVKIGLVESFEVLVNVVRFLKGVNPEVKIIWDPILKASAGFEFHNNVDKTTLYNVLKDIFLITPNREEVSVLFNETEPNKLQEIISDNNISSILLKGGHGDEEYSVDYLIIKNRVEEFRVKRSFGFSKHGTGCVVSSALTANIAIDKTIEESCRDAQKYVSRFIESNSTLLGWHK